MDLVRFSDPTIHAATEHGEVTMQRLQGGGGSSADFALIDHATFAPLARLPVEDASIGKVYVVAEGVLTFEQADGTRELLTEGDSLFVPISEPYAVVNQGNESAALIVIAQRPGTHWAVPDRTSRRSSPECQAIEIVRVADVPTYAPPTSVNPSPEHMPRHIQGGEASSADFVVVNHSTFPPQTRVRMAVAPIGKIYVVLEGAITLETADATRHVMRKGDSVFVPANEARALVNETAAPAIILVIKPPED